jgi:hypothetical protein
LFYTVALLSAYFQYAKLGTSNVSVSDLPQVFKVVRLGIFDEWDLSGYSCKSSGRMIPQVCRASNGDVFRLCNAAAVEVLSS